MAAIRFGLIGMGTHSMRYARHLMHGVVDLTKTAALEYAQQGICVNCVCPGLSQTPMTERALSAPALKAQITARPIGRVGTPEEVAEAAVWLCSDAASFVTGHTMTVGGGYVVQ
jgi:NAD(P)-dependent dehydrogenase (short-subunit alcohol dehydrogenase family)